MPALTSRGSGRLGVARVELEALAHRKTAPSGAPCDSGGGPGPDPLWKPPKVLAVLRITIILLKIFSNKNVFICIMVA
jgi:hypothetical protein